MNAGQFNSYLMNRWDSDSDGFVSSSEWNASARSWYGTDNRRMGSYSAWDTNGDGRLNAGEMNSATTSTRLYQTWDKNGNGVIDDKEYSAFPAQ